MSAVTSPGRRPPPERLFPLVRHLSARVTPLLAATSLTPNQITALSLVFGLGAAAAVTVPGRAGALAAALLLVVAYVLDNCDGEIATLKNMRSAFGHQFDTFADWLVHSAFFAALGWTTAQAGGGPLMAWLGALAAVGGTVNYGLALWFERRRIRDGEGTATPLGGEGDRPGTTTERAVFVFRELFRADFCFLVLGLAAFDVLWLLLPAAAAGAQVYWLGLLVARGRNYHV